MINMTADHMMLGLFLSLIALLVPAPVMLLGALVVVVQTLVFTLLVCIYIGLATEHEHEAAHSHQWSSDPPKKALRGRWREPPRTTRRRREPRKSRKLSGNRRR